MRVTSGILAALIGMLCLGLASADAALSLRNYPLDYDAAGNIVFDGSYYYQYDAWGRLLQVNKASRPGGGSIVITDLVKHHTYDGLGRLVRTESPYPAPGQSGGQLRSERFYYDGIRRIQEVVLDSLADMAMAGGDPQLEQILDETTPNSEELDGDTATLGYEEGQAAAGGGGGGGPVYRGIAREYIWGPGDNGVDELLVQYDEQGYEWWAVQDAGGDLVALCDLGGSGGTARVVGQWTYDAYGAVVTYDQLFPFALPHLGHKGLFFDRLDAGVLDGQGLESPRLVPFARANYHVRNRNYDPAMGRWNQRDPNQTARALIGASAYHGREVNSLAPAFDIEGLHTDGANLYHYLGGAPWITSDPLGLYMWGGWGDTLLKGAEVLALAHAALDTYQFVMEEAVDWALDWERPDDESDDLSAIANAIYGDVDAEVDATAGIYGPAIAGLGNSVRAITVGVKVTAKAKKLFYSWLNKGSDNITVYLGRRNGKPYVGMTNSLLRRGKEHGATLQPIATGLTRNQARTIENQIIKANPHFDNIIQSISDQHRFARWAEEWGLKEIAKRGIQLAY